MTDLHTIVKASGHYNHEFCRIPVPSSLNIAAWRLRLQEYSDYAIVDFLEFGWPLNFTANNPPRSEKRNHKGARDYKSDVDEFLRSEITNGHISGPYATPPFDSFCTSPLNSVPKPDSAERRIIVDLSWPIGEGVNSGIQTDFYLGVPTDLHFPTTDDIIGMIQRAGRECFIYKRDLKAAYRQIPVDPADYNYLGYFWDSNYYFDTRLAMGQRTSALACQRTTRAVVNIMNSKFSTTVYLDDFIGVEAACRAWESYYSMRDILEELGLKENSSKALPPAQRQIVIGVLFDTINMTMSVTPERVAEIRHLVLFWKDKRTASRRELQSLVGKLMFISKCVRQSRVFINRIIHMLRKLGSAHYRTKLTVQFTKDLAWWERFLTVYNGISIIPESDWSAPDSVISTDACLTGCGGVMGMEFFKAEFPAFIAKQKRPIHDLELLSVLVAIRLWSKILTGKRILLYCDNEASGFL